VYASDKIEPLRGYDSQPLLNACQTNLQEGFKRVLEENIRFVKQKAYKMNHPLVQACIHYYLGEHYEK
jgi:HD superfamily phosphohydrolase YqeK